MRKLTNIMTLALLLVTGIASAQRQSAAVLYFDTKGLLVGPSDMSSMVSHELEKTQEYEVLDKYDMIAIIEEKEMKLEGCYGKICAVDAGKNLGVEKVITGSVERFDEKITYTIRLIDVPSASIVRTEIHEFNNYQTHLQKMTTIMVNKLLGKPVNEQMERELEYIDEPIVNEHSTLKASGPRMGVAYIWQGATRDAIEAKGKYPLMTQFGYQHEVQYLSTGKFEALFEFVWLIGGMDQEMFIPQFTFMNGFRNNKSGWEVAFGPAITVRENDGFLRLKSSFIYSVGRTFRSGHLNIPINVYAAPSKTDGWFTGVSFGFNIAKRKQ